MASHNTDNEVCLSSKEEDWYLDSGCSKHITGDKSKFSFLTPKAKGFVTYGDNNQGRILGILKVGKSPQTMIDDAHAKMIGERGNNIYMISLDHVPSNVKCLVSTNDDAWLWHRRIAHIHMDHLNKLVKHDLGIGLPKFT